MLYSHLVYICSSTFGCPIIKAYSQATPHLRATNLKAWRKLETCQAVCQDNPKKALICHHGDDGPEDKCINRNAIEGGKGLFNDAHDMNHCGACTDIDFCGEPLDCAQPATCQEAAGADPSCDRDTGDWSACPTIQDVADDHALCCGESLDCAQPATCQEAAGADPSCDRDTGDWSACPTIQDVADDHALCCGESLVCAEPATCQEAAGADPSCDRDTGDWSACPTIQDVADDHALCCGESLVCAEPATCQEAAGADPSCDRDTGDWSACPTIQDVANDHALCCGEPLVCAEPATCQEAAGADPSCDRDTGDWSACPTIQDVANDHALCCGEPLVCAEPATCQEAVGADPSCNRITGVWSICPSISSVVCGPNAACDQDACVCDAGYEGDPDDLTDGCTSSLPSLKTFLFVSDRYTDDEIPTVLSNEGYSVTTVTNDYISSNGLTTSLADATITNYDAIFWSATGTGSGGLNHNAAMISNLEAYVSGGGYVFVTGYDSIASPDDPVLCAFIGAASSTDGPFSGCCLGQITGANELTTGHTDIQGLIPSGASSDQDTATGLLPGTVGVVPNTDIAGGFVWTLRTLGSGRIAYVSAGSYSGLSEWVNTSTDGSGAYNRALLNFAANAAPPPPSILFVSDSNTDDEIPTVLSNEGYSVTTVTNDYISSNGLTTSLADATITNYDAIFWSATGTGSGGLNHNAAMISNLEAYVSGGGYVFVTGYDSIASPDDPVLCAFIGAASSTDGPFSGCCLGQITGANELTTGHTDIQGLIPSGASSDQDTATGLLPGTVGVVPNTDIAGGFVWTLRTLGSGRIAYVSAGSYSGLSEWVNTSTDGSGAYNRALLNFAANASAQSRPRCIL